MLGIQDRIGDGCNDKRKVLRDIVSVHSPHTHTHTAEFKENTCKSFQTYPNMCFDEQF